MHGDLGLVPSTTPTVGGGAHSGGGGRGISSKGERLKGAKGALRDRMDLSKRGKQDQLWKL